MKLVVGFTCLILATLLEVLKVSATKSLESFLTNLATLLISYFIGYFIVSRLSNLDWGFPSLLKDLFFISVIGSFLFNFFESVYNLYLDWEFISHNQNLLYSRHISWDIYFFISFTAIFFLISFLLSSPKFILEISKRSKKLH